MTHTSNKQKAKSCGCRACRMSAAGKGVKLEDERSHRHYYNMLLRMGKEDCAPIAPHGRRNG